MIAVAAFWWALFFLGFLVVCVVAERFASDEQVYGGLDWERGER